MNSTEWWELQLFLDSIWCQRFWFSYLKSFTRESLLLRPTSVVVNDGDSQPITTCLIVSRESQMWTETKVLLTLIVTMMAALTSLKSCSDSITFTLRKINSIYSLVINIANYCVYRTSKCVFRVCLQVRHVLFPHYLQESTDEEPS